MLSSFIAGLPAPWDTVATAVLVMSSIGLLLGVVIGIFAKYFRVRYDHRVELIVELLPGANCGGCGRAGCVDFAKSLVDGKATPDKCPVSAREQITAIAQVLGIEVGESFARRAVVKCAGDRHHSAWLYDYNGSMDCVSAAMTSGGPKSCSYGCLGLGTCARRCPFGAIEIIDRLAVIHPDLCVGCGQCVNACPRKLIELVPADATCHVYCNNPEKGAEKRQKCLVSCIGCRKCVRVAPGKFVVDGFLAKVNYSAENLPTAEDLEEIKCPARALATQEAHYRLAQMEDRQI